MGDFIGIDTSNYTTSIALYNTEKNTIEQIKIQLYVNKGERGLRQNDAVFLHNKNIPKLINELLSNNNYNIKAFSASISPRNCKGSYMPCFTVGEGYAIALSKALKVVFFGFSHQQGHIIATLFSANKLELLKDNFIAFHISGGTTEVLLVSPNQKDLTNFKINIIGKTLDISCGQVIDRIGTKLNLRFPCGNSIELLANNYKGEVMPLNCFSGENCNFSGLESKCNNLIEQNFSKEEISKYLIESIYFTLSKMIDKYLNHYDNLPLVFTGGVMSNNIIKNKIIGKYNSNLYFASPEYSTDNAVGIAILGALKAGELCL